MNLSATTFDLDNARACAVWSAAAYQQSTISDAATATYCVVHEDADCIIVAFRGTACIRNWVTDARFERITLVSGVDGSRSKVHKGFNAAWNAILTQLFHTLGDTANAHACKPLFITGHSLGGALAVLAALALQRNGFPIAQVYTYGQPRVGNGDFKRRYEAAGPAGSTLGDRTFRVVYEEDIIARVPHLPSLSDPYRHVGTEVFLPSFGVGELVINPSLWYLLASDAWGTYRAWLISKFAGALDPIMDHHVNNYVRALTNLPDKTSPLLS